MNISGEAISLAGVVFNGGITFAFPDDAVLGAGERLILVADLNEFEGAFGKGLPVAGTYSGRLDNSGETISLLGTEGAVIQNFQYDDRAPWPLPADGGGFSLALIAPAENPDLGEAANWRSSLNPGGSPGGSDALLFEGMNAEDLLAYALEDPIAGMTVSIMNLENNGSFENYLVASVSANAGADDAVVMVEFSSDLINWQRNGAVFLGSDERSGGATRLDWRAPTPWSGNEPLRFARLVVTARTR